MEKISVIIPTLNAGETISNIIEKLQNQSIRPIEILIIDSESEDRTIEVASTYSDVKIISILKKDFNHGGTRNIAFDATQGDFVLFLTQDALPESDLYIEKLIELFRQDIKIAMISGKQVPKSDASEIEKLTREFNYPDERNIRTKEDLVKYGIKTFFFSDVCSAYRRDVFYELGKFDEDLNTNEDMLIAAKAIFAGYKVAYEPRARVIHSHNFTLKEQYFRNKAVGLFFRNHESVFSGISNEKEGVKLAKYVIINLIKQFKIISVFYFFMQSFVKLVGYRMGKAGR